MTLAAHNNSNSRTQSMSVARQRPCRRLYKSDVYFIAKSSITSQYFTPQRLSAKYEW